MRRYDHRSPVQPGRSNGWLFVAGAALAVLVWGYSRQRSWYPDAQRPTPSRENPKRADLDQPAAPRNTTLPPLPNRPAEAQGAKANLAAAFSTDDYPDYSIRHEEQGTVAFRLRIDPNGRPIGCVVESSSGSPHLDAATCRILQQRIRATPARDEDGNAIADDMTGRIKWALPEE